MSEQIRQQQRALQRAHLKRLRATAPTSHHAHALVAKTAKEFAATFYEESATHSDAFFNHFPDLDAFVESEWPRFISKAREILASMLAADDLPPATKEEIFDALALDRTLPRPDNLIRPGLDLS